MKAAISVSIKQICKRAKIHVGSSRKSGLAIPFNAIIHRYPIVWKRESRRDSYYVASGMCNGRHFHLNRTNVFISDAHCLRALAPPAIYPTISVSLSLPRG